MVELRKRKEAPPAPEKPTKKKAAPKSKKGDKSAVEETLEQAGEVANTVVAQASEVAGAAVEKAQEVLASATEVANGAKPGPKAGESINLDEFGGEVETHDGKTVTLKQLVEESGAGVILFTYPKASTPGCTTQATAFRDGHSILTATGFKIYGLSTDGPKANTTFHTKLSLPFPLLCDPKHKLISAIGMATAGKTKRGVFIVDKQGKVLEAFQGGPQPTVDAAQRIVSGQGKGGVNEGGVTKKNGEEKSDKKAAETAAEVADSAAKVDA